MSYWNADRAVLHDWNLECDVCDFKMKASQSKKRWDGKIVCPEDWEIRHPQDFYRVTRDDQSVPFTRPPSADNLITDTSTWETTTSEPDGTFSEDTL